MIVTFAWNPNPPSDNVLSYNVYAGRNFMFTAPNSPTNVGNVTSGSYDIGGNYGPWVFALTALNQGGESAFSTELWGFFVLGAAHGSLVTQRISGGSGEGEPTPVWHTFTGPRHMQVTHPDLFSLTHRTIFYPEGATIEHGGHTYQRMAGRWILTRVGDHTYGPTA